MAKEIVQADLGRIRALLDEVLGHSDYSDVQRMGGLTNRTYCVSFSDGSRIMVRIPGEGTEELIDRADEKVSTELACRLGIDAKLYFFGDDGEKVSQFVPNAVTMSAETMRSDKRIRQAAQLLKTLHGSGVDTGVPFEVFDMAAGYEKIIEENSVPMFGDYAQVKAAVMAVKAQVDSVCDIQNVPCHNDPLCENWVVSADDDRLYLIDWEYAGHERRHLGISPTSRSRACSRRKTTSCCSRSISAASPTRTNTSISLPTRSTSTTSGRSGQRPACRMTASPWKTGRWSAMPA